MLELDLLNLVEKIQNRKAEAQTIELKAAHEGCPTKLYDTLSSFSNQDDGGIIIFGLDEQQDYSAVGVYDVQDLIKHVTEQCNQMHPKVRAMFTICDIEGKHVVSAEIPSMDITDRPCYYEGKGRNRGSYIRVGEADEPMTEYEIYSYEAFRRKYEDETHLVERADINDLDESRVTSYITTLKDGKPNLSQMPDSRILDLMSIVREGKPTLAGAMLFCPYPQAFFPQLGIIATRQLSDEIPADTDGERFQDNERIEGPLPDQLRDAMYFIRRNMRTKTSISPQTGERSDVPEYPIAAIREIVLNALIHRDYSIHTQGKPIRLRFLSDRLVISNPGGLYGRLTLDQLGHVQPDTRNPVIATTMEALKLTENRYSGIPAIRRLMSEAGLPEPLFENRHGEFHVTLFASSAHESANGENSADKMNTAPTTRHDAVTKRQTVLEFCSTPRTRNQIAEHLGINSTAYAISRYVQPLVQEGLLQLSLPDKPSSKNQTYQAVQ